MSWGFVRFRGLFAVAALLWVCSACGSDPPSRRRDPLRQPRPKVPTIQVPQPPPPQPPPQPSSRVSVRGLTGTLNKDDVHQTMEAQQPTFDACIAESRRSLRWISGGIRFAFRVGAEGQVEEVHPIESTIGHEALEHCLSDAVAATVFPRPAGNATATFTWGMTVEPVPGRPLEPLDAKVMQKVWSKRRRDVVKTCEIKRRERFQVTAYIARSGRVISAGAVPMPPKASERLECLLGEIASWRMPKVDHHSKVSFLVR